MFYNHFQYQMILFLNLAFLKINYEIFTVHCGSIRQTASILSMSQECLRTGDKALIRFRFIKYPEYIVPGQRMVFREGRTKAVGNVVNIFANTSAIQLSNRAKPSKNQQRYTPSTQQPRPSSGSSSASQSFHQVLKNCFCKSVIIKLLF